MPSLFDLLGDQKRLVADATPSSAALAFALVSRECRDLMYERMPRRGWKRKRFYTPLEAVVGSVEQLRYARDLGCPWDARTCAAAAAVGTLDVLQYARANGCAWDASTASAAAQGGHLEVLRWAKSNGCPIETIACAKAARGGHLHIVRFLRESGCPWHPLTAAWAAGGGHLELLQWARGAGCPWHENVFFEAAWGGHLEVLVWAKDNGARFSRRVWSSHERYTEKSICEYICSCGGSPYGAAARNGFLDILNWFVLNKYPWPKYVCDFDGDSWDCKDALYACAARGGLTGGQRHIIEHWLKDNGVNRSEFCEIEACAAAAAGGQLEMLQFLRSLSPPFAWDKTTCEQAAAGGHLELLIWARSNGASWYHEAPIGTSWNHDMVCKAAECGHLDCLKWIFANGFPKTGKWVHGVPEGQEDTDQNQYMAMYAYDKGQHHVLEWLESNGFDCKIAHDRQRQRAAAVAAQLPASSSSRTRTDDGALRNRQPCHVGCFVDLCFVKEITRQVEDCLSDHALTDYCGFMGKTLAKDFAMLQEMAKAPGQWVRISFLLTSFPTLKTLTENVEQVANAIAMSLSTTIELSVSRTEVRRKKPLTGMVGAMSRGELVLVREEVWVHAVWKDEEGLLQSDCEKMQQAQQLGCIPDNHDFNCIPGAHLDLRRAIKEAPEAVREGDRQGKIWPVCRWGVACPRLSTDESHTAKHHTPEQARLAEGEGVTAAVRALGGRWMTDEMREEALEALASQADACPCYKGGAGFCVIRSYHNRQYWQGEETVARLQRLEPDVDQSPAAWKEKRETKTKEDRLARSQFEIRGVNDTQVDFLNGIYCPVFMARGVSQRYRKRCEGSAWPCARAGREDSSEDIWIEFDAALGKWQVKKGSMTFGNSSNSEGVATALMQSAETAAPPTSSLEEASGWEVYNSESKDWQPESRATVAFHSFV